MELILFFLALAAIAYGIHLDFEARTEGEGKPQHFPRVFEFRLNGLTQGSERPAVVASAELLVRVERALQPYTLVVFEYIPNDLGDVVGRAKVEVESWQHVDVTGVAQRWVAEGARVPLGLQLACIGCAHSVQSRLGCFRKSRPLLHLRLHPRRRPTVDCNANSNGSCCRQIHYVSFRKLRWDDWILAPEGYYANYCRGTCPATYHSQVAEAANLEHSAECCAPVRYSALSVVYYGNDTNIHKRDFPNMVVEECGCS